MVGVLLGVLTGCEATSRGGQSPFLDAQTLPAPSPAERDSAIAQLDRMDRAVFDSAFVRMDRYAFTRSTRTEQLTPDGAVAALRRVTLRVAPDSGARVVDADTVGTFGSNLFSGFASDGDADPLPGPLGEYVLDDKPAYRSARSREAFDYRTRPDTLDGVPVTVVTVTARDTGEGAEQSIRRATLTLTRDGLDVVAMSTIRAERSILFTEDSRFVVRLRRAPDDVWVPALTRFHARVGVPFRDAQAFRTVTAYTDYRRVGDAA